MYSMDGGIEAWNGHVATGKPDQGMNLLEGVESVEDFIMLGMKLEDGTRIFYSEAKERFGDDTSGKVFEMLVNAEINHKKLLADAYRHISGRDLSPDDMEKVAGTDIIESGESLQDILLWMKTDGRSEEEVLDLAMQIETNSLDLYLKIEREIDDKNAIKLLKKLIAEEKQHLSSLGKLLGSRMS